MNTELEDRLSERMRRLADGLSAPVVGPEDDLARGRRRARALRTSGIAAALAVGVVAGGTGYLVHASVADPAAVGPASSGSGSQHAGHSAKNNALSAKKALKRVDKRMKTTRTFQPDRRVQDFRAAVADALDPAGRHLDPKATNEQTMGRAYLGTKLGWKEGAGLGEILVGVSRPGVDDGGFTDFDASGCVADATHPCTPVTLPDGTSGLQQRRDGELAVYYVRPDKQVVMLVESTLFGNNSTVSISALPVTARHLLKAASDPRMTLDR